MHAGKLTDMKRGAIWACVIPVGLGVVATILTGVLLMEVAADGQPALPGALMLFPIIGCFIFGTPLAARLACRSLAKIETPEKLSRWRSSAGRGLWSASLVHIIWAGLYTLGFAAASFNNAMGFFPHAEPSLERMSSLFMLSVLTNIAAWIIITLPLSLLCATIFWRVTKFPDNTDVF